MSVFWLLMVVIVALRIAIAISRTDELRQGSNLLQSRINLLHMGYFISIALVELCGSGFLIQVLARARRTSRQSMSSGIPFLYLLRTTEVRMATLAGIGVGRAVTYSYQATSQSATTIASQVDRFFAALECLFPFMML